VGWKGLGNYMEYIKFKFLKLSYLFTGS
jgi:hypothetical protein